MTLAYIVVYVDLKANVVRYLGVVIHGRDRYYRDAVDEACAVFAVVDKRNLYLFVLNDGTTQISHGVGASKLSMVSAVDLPTGRLQEATVTAKDFGFGVSSELAERVRNVYYRNVISARVRDDKCASEVYKAQLDTLGWAPRDPIEERENSEIGQ